MSFFTSCKQFYMECEKSELESGTEGKSEIILEIWEWMEWNQWRAVRVNEISTAYSTKFSEKSKFYSQCSSKILSERSYIHINDSDRFRYLISELWAIKHNDTLLVILIQLCLWSKIWMCNCWLVITDKSPSNYRW